MNKWTQRKHDRIKEGICVQCGCRFYIPGHVKCEHCMEVRWNRVKEIQAERALKGLCKIHGNPVVSNTKSCLVCQNNWNKRRYK